MRRRPEGHETPAAALRAEQFRAFLIFQLVFWGADFAIRTIAAIEHRPQYAFAYMPERVLIIAAGLLATTLVHFALARVERWPQLARLGLGLGLCVLLLPPMNALERSLAARVTTDAASFTFTDYILQFGWVFLMWAGYYFAQDQLFRVRRQAVELTRAQAAAHAAQLKMLRYQLNPHFLFNALNAISALVLEGRNAEAEKMLMHLSRFLRHTIDSDPAPLSRLGDEARVQRLYLEVEAVRFGEKLRVQCSVPESLHECLVPSLLLQPIVENAIKHGVAQLADGGWIRIAAARDGGRLLLSVENDGPPVREVTSAHGGVGLRNTEERLRAIYGGDASVRIAVRAEGGVRVEISLPWQTAQRPVSLAPA
jgi:signal transduction histidine kinase